MVIRGPNGGGVQLSAQHTHSLEGFYGHFPGLKVVSPVTPHDAKGMMLTAIREPNPVIFLEAGALYGTKGEVPEGEVPVPFGKARIAREGTDVTLVGYGRQVNMLLRVADRLAEDGISAEVIDLRSIRPFDEQTLVESVRKTHRAVVVQEQWRWYSVARGRRHHPGAGVRRSRCPGGARQRRGSAGALRPQSGDRGLPERAAGDRRRAPRRSIGSTERDNPMPNVIMPKMGDAMEEGTLLRWLKQVGDEIAVGDPLAEIETDKVSLEIEATEAGVLSKTYVDEGATVPIGTPIAAIGEESADVAGQRAAGRSGRGGRRRRNPRRQRTAGAGGGSRRAAPTGGAAADVPAAGARRRRRRRQRQPAPGERLRASPLVKRLAAEHGIDLSSVIRHRSRRAHRARTTSPRCSPARRASPPAPDADRGARAGAGPGCRAGDASARSVRATGGRAARAEQDPPHDRPPHGGVEGSRAALLCHIRSRHGAGRGTSASRSTPRRRTTRPRSPSTT